MTRDGDVAGQWGEELLTVRCGQCASEHRGGRETIGRLMLDPEGVIRWVTVERAQGVRMVASWETLSHPRRSDLGEPTTLRARVDDGVLSYEVVATGTLRAFCRHHGPGTVSMSDVVSARGSIVLTLNAPA